MLSWSTSALADLKFMHASRARMNGGSSVTTTLLDQVEKKGPLEPATFRAVPYGPDQAVQRLIAAAARRLGRREFLSRGAAATAAGIATVVLGPLGGKQRQAFGHSNNPCTLPCGYACGGCSSTAGCPSGMLTCTTAFPYPGCCIYSTGWWYTSGAAGTRHRCRDCIIAYCPCCCTQGCCSGICGCRSTVHY